MSVEELLTVLSLCMNHCIHHRSAGEKTQTNPISLSNCQVTFSFLNTSQDIQGGKNPQTLEVFSKLD